MKFLAAAFFAALLPGVRAQTRTFVVPGKYAKARGNASGSGTFCTSVLPYHAQWLYNTSDIALQVGVIRGMALRRMSVAANLCPQATATLTIKMSVGPKDAASASTTFAANLGSRVIQVFSGKINLPKSNWVPPPNLPPWLVIIPFSKPFFFLKASGKSLVTDIRVTAYNPAGSTRPWWLDAAKKEYGQWRFALKGFPLKMCKYSNGRLSLAEGVVSAQLYPGGYFYFANGGMPPNLSGILMLGSKGPGATWAGFKLPFSLAFLGAGTCG